MASLSISEAMKAIKDEKCCECGRQAKGLVYRVQSVSYYCKKCLHRYMEQEEIHAKEAAATPA